MSLCEEAESAVAVAASLVLPLWSVSLLVSPWLVCVSGSADCIQIKAMSEQKLENIYTFGCHLERLGG